MNSKDRNTQPAKLESKLCIIFTSTNDKDVASSITVTLLEENLAACVQQEAVLSSFKWIGKLCMNEPEFRLMIKANAANYKAIEKRIIELHNYETPEIIKIDVTDGAKAYLEWALVAHGFNPNIN